MVFVAPGPARRAAVAALLLVPLVVDPLGADTLAFKRLALVLVGALAFLGEALALARRGEQPLRPTAPELWLAALALWAAVSLSWAVNTSIGLLEVAAILGLLGATRGVRACLGSQASWSGWLVALLGAGLVAGLVDGVAISRQVTDLARTDAKYASWLFVHNNMAGAYLTMLIPVPFALALGTRSWARRAGWAVLVLAGLGALVQLRGRAALGAAVLGMAVVAVGMAVARRRAARQGLSRGVLILATLIVVPLLVVPFSEGARGLAKDTFYRGVNLLVRTGISDLTDADFRPDVYRKTLDMIEASSPALGVGAGNFPVVHTRHDATRMAKPHAHNEALHVAAELGFVGLALFAGWLLSLAWTWRRALSGVTDGASAAPVVACAGVGAAYLVSGVFEVPFLLGAVGVNLAVVMALMSSMARGAAGPAALRLPRSAGLPLAVLAVVLVVFVIWRTPASYLLERAQQQLQDHDVEAAEATLVQLSHIPTGSFVAERQLGVLALLRGENEVALLWFQRARASWPWGVELLQSEGEALLALGREDEAIERFREALERTPGVDDALFRYVQALGRAGRLDEAAERLEFEVQSDPGVSPEVVLQLAQFHRRRAEQASGAERVAALVAARHFLAEILERAPADMGQSVAKDFKHITHQLQSLPGAPDSWWKQVYDPWLAAGGWSRPMASLWTAMDADGQRIYPGWVEVTGPPLPRSWP